MITVLTKCSGEQKQKQKQQPKQRQKQQQLVVLSPSSKVTQEKVTLRTLDTCAHPAASEIAIADGAGGEEVACGACGMVKTEDEQYNVQQRQATEFSSGVGRVPGTQLGTADCNNSSKGKESHNRANLYLELSVGGRPDRTLRGERYVRKQSDLGYVSNISQKLGVPNHVSLDVWKWYQRLRQHLNLTKSKCLVLAFCRVCRGRGCPIDEDRLLECIRMELGVRYAYSYLRVMMEASSYLQDGEMVLRRIGFLDVVVDDSSDHNYNGTDDSNSQENAIRYHLGREITLVAQRRGPAVANIVGRRARDIIPHITKRETNASRAARIAVRMAERRVCGATGMVATSAPAPAVEEVAVAAVACTNSNRRRPKK